MDLVDSDHMAVPDAVAVQHTYQMTGLGWLAVQLDTQGIEYSCQTAASPPSRQRCNACRSHGHSCLQSSNRKAQRVRLHHHTINLRTAPDQRCAGLGVNLPHTRHSQHPVVQQAFPRHVGCLKKTFETSLAHLRLGPEGAQNRLSKGKKTYPG